MSRGLGKLQQEILTRLEAGGEWRYVRDLACEIHPGEFLLRSALVATTRAAHGLAARGLLRVEEIGVHFYARPERLACWLPSQAEPSSMGERLRAPRTTPGAEVERLALAILKEQAEEAATYNDFAYALFRRLRLGNYDTGRHYVALGRALRRLALRGELRLGGDDPDAHGIPARIRTIHR